MKIKNLQLFLLIIIAINYTTQQYLSLKKFETEHYKIQTGTWRDLIGVLVECPNKGVMKNFILKKDSTYFWYEFYCYSSDKDEIDEGEPIIKNGGTLTSRYYVTTSIKDNISMLNNYPFSCWVDNGLTSFQLTYDSGTLTAIAHCKKIKSLYVTKYDFQTTKVTASATTMDGLANILVGSTDAEDDENIAYPLRGFKIIVDTSKSKDNPTISYKYGYSSVRNMKTVLHQYQENFKKLRDGNNQKN